MVILIDVASGGFELTEISIVIMLNTLAISASSLNHRALYVPLQVSAQTSSLNHRALYVPLHVSAQTSSLAAWTVNVPLRVSAQTCSLAAFDNMLI